MKTSSRNGNNIWTGAFPLIFPETTLSGPNLFVRLFFHFSRPPELASFIQTGVPDAVRGQIWILLAKAYNDEDLIQMYHTLLEKESLSEQVILRDIHRTFPAHEYFKEPNGEGQQSLYKISKAYSLYDDEVGYCQGREGSH